MDYKKLAKLAYIMMAGGILLTGCSDDEATSAGIDPDPETNFGKAVGNFLAEEWYPGGELGTTEDKSYSDPTPATVNQGLETSFVKGEAFFTGNYTLATAPYRGLGSAWVRSSCIHCHPSYGHGKFQTEYKANTVGNGYLLVIYHPDEAYTSDGVRYTTSNSKYISEVTGMPQTKAMTPFKAPVEESGIHVAWKSVSAMPSGLPMQFSDGETFALQYPEVTIEQSAFNTNPKPTDYEVRLEGTIGVYGTGLIDAISDDDMKAQYQAEAPYVELNPAMWDKAANDWAASAMYTANGVNRIKKFTYAMTRGSLQDGAGANAIWNITNVTRSDRHYLYTTKAWAKAMSEDADVISYIKANGNKKSSLLYPFYADGTDAGIAERVNMLLGLNSAADAETYKQYFVDESPWNGKEEMSDKDYYDFMVWHRGLAVPAARNLDNEKVQKGKEVFMSMGCQTCHRPKWQTRNDDMWTCSIVKSQGSLPTYKNQTIYPYTDMVQHRLFMENDIRTGWCRTTPLWGRGLSSLLTGRQDRLHDYRARNVIEAIMWHCYSKDSDAYNSAKKMYDLTKEERDALVAFINAI
ncbi:MAG: c-type cytochrome [Prevotella sp.]|nr:c-type cytochrome [Prevotella sp.]